MRGESLLDLEEDLCEVPGFRVPSLLVPLVYTSSNLHKGWRAARHGAAETLSTSCWGRNIWSTFHWANRDAGNPYVLVRFLHKCWVVLTLLDSFANKYNYFCYKPE